MPHRHDHPTPHGGEAATGPSQEASVLVDVGEGVGAAVVRTPAALAGAEIEIRPVGGSWAGVHTAVRERRVPAGTQFAAVFGSLPEGRYELRVKGRPGERPPLVIDVAGASVLDVAWPGMPAGLVVAHVHR
ncbi:MAG TPA: hypothetical protein VKG43_02235 [Acidimicrobiales bacterium]|nr:hypothetical protein [Acidimicrobiales bacterium]